MRVLLLDGNANAEYIDTDPSVLIGDQIKVKGSLYTLSRWTLGETNEVVGFCDDADLQSDETEG
jgi:hypothetical protein